MANASVAVASCMEPACDSSPAQADLDSSACESLPGDICGSTAAVLTEDMMKEEAILHKVAVAKEEETRKVNMEKMRSLAQEECYKRLTLLLEKSKHYTAHVHDRMQAQKAQLEELQQQIREQRQAKAAAMAVKRAKDAERQLDIKQSRAKCKQPSNVTALKSLDENDNLLVPCNATLTESDHCSTNSERMYSVGDTVNVMVMPENVTTTARVLKIDCSNNTGKQYFVHYDQLIQKSNDWISEDLLVGKVATVRRSSSRSSVIASNVLRQKQEAVATPSESRRSRKRKVDDNFNEEQNKRLKKDEVLVLSSESESTCIISSSEDGIRTSSQSTDSSAPDSSEQNDTMLAHLSGDEQPLLLTGGKLRLYQLEGFKWLKMLYENGVNGILADEMGLGKTIQCIALICHLLANGVDGPFFLCAPLSTIPNWIAEFARFAPKVPVILYHGNRQDRAILRRDIRRRRAIDFAGIIHSFPVVVTSYEIAMNDREFLMNHVWKLLIVDEGHRIKNNNCRLIRELKMYNSIHRLLLTGTPLQNNMAELWSLLNFLIPEIFNSLGSFETWFDVAFLESTDNAHEQIVYEEQKKHTISMLHQILTPFMLRRLKSDVDFVIPPKREIVVYAPMTSKQEQFYRSVLDKTIRQLIGKPETKKESSPEKDSKGRPIRQARNRSINLKMLFDENEEEESEANDNDIGNNAVKSKRAKRRSLELDEESDESIEKWAESVLQYHKQTDDLRIRIGEEKGPLSALVNVQLRNSLALLRRCCNHPYLIEYPMKTDVEFRIDEELISSCGKLMLLDRMLTGLKQGGHKVLVFSQMTQMIDILEDYCMYRGHSYCRLDGKMKMLDRQSEIDRFNNDDVFLFLLSTRAGGLGINLTQADTVVIYDSDWNPQCDLQAQDRCHRIGQNRPVIVYRLVTANTVDQKIVDRATAKRKLEKLVIHKGKFKSSTDSFRTDFEPISPQELLTLLQESDYQEMLKQANDCNVITDDDLCRLLDRSELNRRWTRRLAGQTDEEETDSSNIDGVFQIVNEIWDDPVRKCPGDEPSIKS